MFMMYFHISKVSYWFCSIGMRDRQTEFSAVCLVSFRVHQDGSLNKTCIMFRYLSTYKTSGPCSKWWCYCAIIWCGVLRSTVLRISAGSLSISFGRCCFRRIWLLMRVVSPRFVFFCGLNAVLIGCPWIIWRHFLFLSRYMCKWSISFFVIVDRYLFFFEGLSILW
jgi:hypothetical protein